MAAVLLQMFTTTLPRLSVQLGNANNVLYVLCYVETDRINEIIVYKQILWNISTHVWAINTFNSVFWTLNRILSSLVVILESGASVVFLHALLFIATTYQNWACLSLMVGVWRQSSEQKGANLQTRQHVIAFLNEFIKRWNSSV